MSMRGVVLTCLVLLSQSQAVFPVSQEERAQQTIESFYKSYIHDVNERTSTPHEKRRGSQESLVLKRSQYFTSELLQAYRKLLKDPELDYDPILQSNDIPEGFRTKKVRVEGPTAYVSLEYIGYPENTPLLDARLKLQNGKWLIDRLGHLNDHQPKGKK